MKLSGAVLESEKLERKQREFQKLFYRIYFHGLYKIKPKFKFQLLFLWSRNCAFFLDHHVKSG
jgi:hypothetical protein